MSAGFTLQSRRRSPFGRKILFCAGYLGLSGSMRFLEADDVALLESRNPLGKVPALVLDDGRVLYDSRVILEFLDHAAGGGRIIPSAPDARFEALRQAALADGILEAALLIVYEARYRPDLPPYQPWLEFQRGKIVRALAASQAAPPALRPLTVGAVGLACALEYLEFRKPVAWPAGFSGLVRWLADFNAAYPEFAESRPGT